jgi:multidrug efflux system membrane fusion protein
MADRSASLLARLCTRAPMLMLLGITLSCCSKAPAESMVERPPLPVRVARVVYTPQQASMTLSGTVQSRRLATLSFRVGGKLVERSVEIGDHVRAGQVLARLDPNDLQLAFEAAQSELQSAQAAADKARGDFSRYERLGPKSPAFIPAEYDNRLAAARVAEARLAQVNRQLALAKSQLTYGTLTADADGVITALSASVGQVVASGQTIAALARTDEIEVVVDVPENRLPHVRSAKEVQIKLWADPDRVLYGRIREIGAQADAGSRTFTVKLTVLQPPPGLLALGMTAIVTFLAPATAPVAIVPGTALTDRSGALAVWVFDPARRRASLRPVTVSNYGPDGTVAIATGLDPDEQVVTAGVTEIDSDMRLTLWTGASR